LGRIPGLTVSIRGDVRSARGGCRPDVFIDGVRTNPAGRGTPALGDMEVNDFAAIEYYGIGQVPAQYNQIGAGCGAILLWTRER
jgi:outer membrane cobalamin receptor